MFLAALPVNGSEKVSIGLFALFRPQSVLVRLAAGENAVVEAAAFTGNRIYSHQVISISVAGNRLKIDVQGSEGINSQTTFSNSVRITPDGSAALELILPGKMKRVVRGTLSIDGGTSGRGPLRIVLITSSEAAVASIVAAETSEREPQGLMALAVVVRTFMLSHSGRHAAEGFDFCDTTHCQLYRGEQDLLDSPGSRALSAFVTQTSGQVVRFQGAPLEGYYTAACGGLTSTPIMVWGGQSRYPYTRISCEWCRTSQFNRWERSADRNRILNALSAFTGSKLSSATELIADLEPDGFVRSVTLRDGNTRSVLNSDTFRRAIGLQMGWSTVLSPTFTITRNGSRYIFRGRGFGSQVGLCVTGAMAQARAGRGYRDILSFYYPATEISEATPR